MSALVSWDRRRKSAASVIRRPPERKAAAAATAAAAGDAPDQIEAPARSRKKVIWNPRGSALRLSKAPDFRAKNAVPNILIFAPHGSPPLVVRVRLLYGTHPRA